MLQDLEEKIEGEKRRKGQKKCCRNKKRNVT